MQPLNTTCTCSFILPQGFSTPPTVLTYVSHKDQHVCIRLAERKPEVQWYTDDTREAVGGITAHFITQKKGEKKSSRIMWLLHSTVAALLEMLAENRWRYTNERKEELLTSSLRTTKSPRATCIMGNITFSRVWYHIINNATNAAVLLFNATMKWFTLSVPLSVYDQLRLTSSDKAFSVQSRHQTDEILSTYQWLVSCLNLQRVIHVTWLISDSHGSKYTFL